MGVGYLYENQFLKKITNFLNRYLKIHIYVCVCVHAVSAESNLTDAK